MDGREASSEEHRCRTAIAEHARLEREILALTSFGMVRGEEGVLAGLRACAAVIARELEARGYLRTRSGWHRAGPQDGPKVSPIQATKAASAGAATR